MKIQLRNKGKDTGYLEINNKNENKAELLIYGDISSDKWTSTDVVPNEVKNILDEADGRELDIYINSNGGDVFAGLAIYNMLLRYKSQKNVYIDGLAASAASIIALAGDTVNIPRNAFLMIHRASTIAWGNLRELQETIKLLEKTDSTIADIYMSNKKDDDSLTKEVFLDLMDKTTWLNGEEAANYFNVNVIESKNIAACIDEDFCKRYSVPESLKNSLNAEKEKIKNKNIINLEKEKLKLKLKLGGI